LRKEKKSREGLEERPKEKKTNRTRNDEKGGAEDKAGPVSLKAKTAN